MWSQTPQFDVSLDSSDDIGIDMNVHHGIIKSLDFKDSRMSTAVQHDLRSILVQEKLQDIADWESFLQDRLQSWDDQTVQFAQRLEAIMPIPELTRSPR